MCVCVCVCLRECKDVECNFPCVEKVCLYQYLCLVHISSFLVMIIMSRFLRCQIFMQVFPALPQNWRKVIIIVERINIPGVGIMLGERSEPQCDIWSSPSI